MTRDELLIAVRSLPADVRIMCSDGFNPATGLIHDKRYNELRLVHHKVVLTDLERKNGQVKVI